MVCVICKGRENLVRAKDEEGKIVQICEKCYEKFCESYELLP